jgi:hypothetical protein
MGRTPLSSVVVVSVTWPHANGDANADSPEADSSKAAVTATLSAVLPSLAISYLFGSGFSFAAVLATT